MYKHIIWDFDGTLFDTYPVMGSIFQKLLLEEGYEESLDEILKYMKISHSHALHHYEEKYQISRTFIERYNKQRKEIELSSCKPYDGIVELCRYIKDSGRGNYIYTHRGESTLHFLDKFGIYDCFKDFITSEHGFERKPSPEAIEYLINKYNMDDKETIMVGDRDLDILSAKNAGIDACFFSEDGRECDYADVTIKSFKEFYSILDN